MLDPSANLKPAAARGGRRTVETPSSDSPRLQQRVQQWLQHARSAGISHARERAARDLGKRR